MNPLALSNEEYRQGYERIAQLALGYLAGISDRSSFRYAPFSGGLNDTQFDNVNVRSYRNVQRRGRVYVSNANIHGKFALRACIVNHRTTVSDVEAFIDEVLRVGKELSSGAQS